VDDERVKDIANRVGKTVHQVIIRWALQRRPGTSVIVKSTTPEHIKVRHSMPGCPRVAACHIHVCTTHAAWTNCTTAREAR
jgi:hypothetical protein